MGTAIDDGSTDNSLVILQQFKSVYPEKVKLLSSNKKQANAAYCRNIGLATASGELILFLDADDTIEPFCLMQRVEVMTKNPDAEWAIFRQFCLPGDNYQIYTRSTRTFEQAVSLFYEMNPPWTVTCPIWRKTFLEELKGFDTSFVFMEDPELHLRALLLRKQLPVIAWQYPPDSYYRKDNFSNEKLSTFYENSIESRLHFLSNVIYEHVNVNIHAASIRKGFLEFVRVFVLGRFEPFRIQVLAITKKLKDKKVISKADYLAIRFAACSYCSKNRLVRLLKLKGLAYSWLLYIQ